VTLHRQCNVDDIKKVKFFCELFGNISKTFGIKIIYPVHPRNKKLFYDYDHDKNIMLIEPQGYIEFMNLLINSKLVITDSGGMQEETTYLNIPCITLRPNTERPITIEKGTNTLIKELDENIIMNEIKNIVNNKHNYEDNKIKYWDGKTAERIVDILKIL
jgi:UDP-N-acetylglucosamine 2-epimerase (non-hydrolysing)